MYGTLRDTYSADDLRPLMYFAVKNRSLYVTKLLV